MMSRVRTAVAGNLLSAFAILLGVVATLFFTSVVSAWTIWPALLLGALIGSVMARQVKMIQMPQTVALFNGLGGGASALVGLMSVDGNSAFQQVTSLLAIAVGMVTLIGSLVAAGKLHRLLNQRPVVCHDHITHFLLLNLALLLMLWAVFAPLVLSADIDLHKYAIMSIAGGTIFGLLFSIRVGGADMPITISLLNSLSGVAGAIAGMAIGDVFLVAVGGIVGASGLLLTQIMCRAMNRSLVRILMSVSPKNDSPDAIAVPTKSNTPTPEQIKRVMDLEKKIRELEEIVKNLEERVHRLQEPLTALQENRFSGQEQEKASALPTDGAVAVLSRAKDVIIVPGYGMALAQAQHQVRQLADKLESRGARVRYAIHPVAGRMPGHMNVLLAEADVDYEKLFEMDAINDDFKNCDAVVVIGANDVMNPAARHAEGTPIYGMPVLNVDEAPHVVVCNFDLKPGYAGVENPLYSRDDGVYLELGDARETLMRLINELA